MSKTFLSIGSGPGIGLATARRFAREGYKIILSSRDDSQLTRYAASIEGDVSVVKLDVNNVQKLAEFVEKVSEASELVLHYNAGVLHYDSAGVLQAQSIEGQGYAEIISDIQVNLTSALIATKAAIPSMKARKSGTVLLTGGGFGVYPTPDFLTMSIGKAGIRALTSAMFEPLKNDGIHIATVTVSQLVSPGSVASEEIAEQFWKIHAAPKDAWTWDTYYGPEK